MTYRSQTIRKSFVKTALVVTGITSLLLMAKLHCDQQPVSVRMAEAMTSELLEFPKIQVGPRPICCPIPWFQSDVCRNLAALMNERKDRQTYLHLFKYFDEMASKFKWTYFISYGTLLGSWRHHDVIPWDEDADFMVEYKDRLDVVARIKEQGRFVAKQDTRHKILLYDRDNHGPSIDISFFSRNVTHIHRSDNKELYVFKIEEIFPLHRRPMSTLSLQSPRDTLKHLTTYYTFSDICAKGGYGFPKCKAYERYLAFVHRKWKNSKMEESLILDGKVLHVKRVDEMKENMPFNAYTFASKRFQEEARP